MHAVDVEAGVIPLAETGGGHTAARWLVAPEAEVPRIFACNLALLQVMQETGIVFHRYGIACRRATAGANLGWH